VSDENTGKGADSTPIYPFLAIDVPAIAAEVAAEQLFELGALGVERRDATTLVKGAGAEGIVVDHGADVVESSAVWESQPGEVGDDAMVTLVAAFETREAALEAMEAFDEELHPRIEEVVGDAWRDAWKEHFAAFRISPRIVIEPPWKPADRALIDEVPGTKLLTLEPGRAFGTGLHPTTALVAGVVDALGDRLVGLSVLDLGCGSGILSLVALMLGAARVRATDLDVDAVRITRENAENLHLADRLDVDASTFEQLTGRYPLVLANIQAEVLVPHAAAIQRLVAPGGTLVLSGILITQKERVREAYAAMKLIEAPTRGEWVALVLSNAA